jgi:hypothetical protein
MPSLEFKDITWRKWRCHMSLRMFNTNVQICNDCSPSTIQIKLLMEPRATDDADLAEEEDPATTPRVQQQCCSTRWATVFTSTAHSAAAPFSARHHCLQ